VLASGYGRELALSELKLPASLFRNTLEGDPEFRVACNTAQKAAEQQLGANAFRLAMQGNIDILMKLLDRFDRGHRLKIGRMEAAKDRQLRMKLAEMALECKAGNPSLVLGLVPIITEALQDAVGPEQASLALETLVRRLDEVIQSAAFTGA
jgi:hypothetical protein